MLRTKFAWADYFTGNPEITLNGLPYLRQTPSAASVYVSNCLFSGCTISSGNGGALSCSTSTTYLLVESSSFFTCKTDSGKGGAICFINTNYGQSVLYGICCFDCCSSSYGPFAYTALKQAASTKNYANYTSITRCGAYSASANEVLSLEYGVIYCPSVNISMNDCNCYSGFFCTPYADASSVTCLLSYSSAVDNRATRYNFVWLNNGGVKYEIKCCNFLRNTQTSSSYGIFFTRGNTAINDCCILENKATYIFTLSNCTLDSTSHYNSFTMKNTVTKSFILGLDYLSTRNCHAEYDSAGTLTAIPYVSRTTTKSFCYYNTCKNQARISELLSLVWVFIVSFIHPDPSGDCL